MSKYLPVEGDIDKLTARYYQFGDSPYSINGSPVINPDGTLFGFKHHGSDIDVAVGTPTFAPEDGVITQAGNAGTAGIMITIEGASGRWRMLHMSKLVRFSGSIKAKELVGYSGKTGYSRDIPHIHMDLARGGKFVDPLKDIKELKVTKLGETQARRMFKWTRGRLPSETELKRWANLEVSEEFKKYYNDQFEREGSEAWRDKVETALEGTKPLQDKIDNARKALE